MEVYKSMEAVMAQVTSTDSIIVQQLNQLNNTQHKTHKTAQKSDKQDASDKISIGMDKVYKSLTVLGDEVIKKLNEALGDDLPGGIASLNPEEHTSEKTADRIVAGVTSMLPVFSKQNPNLQGEELISKFMDTIRGGVSSGYQSAVGILGDIGAFEFDGVKDDISKTMDLVEEKLKAFEDQYRKDNGLASGADETTVSDEGESAQ